MIREYPAPQLLVDVSFHGGRSENIRFQEKGSSSILLGWGAQRENKRNEGIFSCDS